MTLPLRQSDDTAPARYVRGMERLVKAVQELSLARDLPTIQRIVRTTARELTGADGATFVLRDNGQCFYADEDAIAPLWKGKRFPMEICISGWAMLNRTSTVIPDIYEDPRIPADAYRPTFVKSLAMVPIRTLDPIGAIGNYWARRHQPDVRDVALLQALADTTAVAMENVQVYTELEQRVRDRTAELQLANEEIRRISLADELTGLHNRRGFYLLAEQALRRARRDGRPAHAVFIDVDGLKPVNDQLGHEMGDALITDVARALEATFRESDVLGRLGGDEFAVLTPDPLDDPEALRRRLAQSFEDFGRGRPFQLSASVGIAALRAGRRNARPAAHARRSGDVFREAREEEAARPGAVAISCVSPARVTPSPSRSAWSSSSPRGNRGRRPARRSS